MSNAIINIKGTQYLDGDGNVTEWTGEGTYSIFMGQPVMFYDEGAMLGGNVKAKLTVGKNGIMLERNGDISTRMTIESGKRHNCRYNTMHGDIMLGVYGKDFTSDFSDKGGKLSMKYTLDLNSGLLSENKIEITVKTV